MGWWQRLTGREVRINPLENPTIPISASYDDLMAFFGVSTGKSALPLVTVETALEVPAVFDAVAFLSRTNASLPLHAYRKSADGEAKRLDGDLQMLLNEAPNPDWSSFDWRRYMWRQAFTLGRGLTWIERAGNKIMALWPMDASITQVRRQGGHKLYRFEGRDYPSEDVIDVPYMLKDNQVDVWSPILKGKKAIGLAIAMNDFAGNFFGSGGMPPLALSGPLPQGAEAFKRAQADIQRAVDYAKEAGRSFVGMPPGHELKPIGTDPDKGQMTEARLFQIQEIARIFGLPPAFLQDLSRGTFSNTEQQDLQLVKHSIAHWARAFEDELNLKLFGQRRRSQYVEHNLDGLMRGDFKSRIDALARGVQTALITPNEARELENRGPKDGGDSLYMQGATVPIDQAGTKQAQDAAAAGDQGNNADGNTAQI